MDLILNEQLRGGERSKMVSKDVNGGSLNRANREEWVFCRN